MRWWPVFRSWVLACTLGIALSGCAAFWGGPSTTQASTLSAVERKAWNLRVYDRATNLVTRRYFDASFGGRDWPGLVQQYRNEAVLAEDDRALYRIINSLLQELKASHLAAFTAQQSREERTRERARVGLMWHRYGSDWAVEDIVPGSPAEQAGIERGWVVEYIDGAPAEEAIRRRLGDGETVTMQFRDRLDQPQTKTLQARIISLDTPMREWILDGGYVYLRFDEFDRRSRRWLSDALKRHREAPGVILDLRFNHGGQLFSLDFVAGEFFPHQVSIGKMIRRGGSTYGQASRQWASARFNGPVVVLINDSSYSAAEILAHVLQHTKRATLVGRKTGGAVVAARNFGLPGGGTLQIPILDYVGLHGRRLEGDGVEPDVPVKRSLAALRSGRDLDVEAALAVFSRLKQ